MKLRFLVNSLRLVDFFKKAGGQVRGAVDRQTDNRPTNLDARGTELEPVPPDRIINRL